MTHMRPGPYKGYRQSPEHIRHRAESVIVHGKTPEQRFWSHVEKTDGCWLWTAARFRQGYGEFHVGGKKGHLVYAHRYSWELAYGPIPEGADILHRCDNPPCVRPDHLWAGTHAENMADMVAKGRSDTARGSANGNSRLTEADIPRIRALAAEGWSQRRIAREFGVTRGPIQAILCGRAWRQME